MKKLLPFLLLLISSFGYSQVNKAETEIDFDLNGTSQLVFINKSKDTVRIDVNNWIFIRQYMEKIDSLLLPYQSINLSITSYTKDYIYININKKNVRMYIEPHIASTIIIQSDKDKSIDFRGKHEKINKYINQRGAYSDFMPRNFWYQGGGTVPELINAYDSITAVQQKGLNETNGLPIWYKKYEGTRLDYVNAEIKLSAVNYRKYMLGKKDTLPNNFFKKTVNGLSIDDKEFIGTSTYNGFVLWYLAYTIDPTLENDFPKNKNDWMIRTKTKIEAIQKYLSNSFLRDIYLCYYLNGLIDNYRHLMDEKWINLIQNSELRSLVNQQLLEIPVLPQGAKMPYFYLEDVDSVYFDSNTLKDKVVLINFWATWCKPCYKQFEHENNLVETFKGEPVAIINICISSNKEKWKELVKKYNLLPVNLYANENWSDVLEKKYDISGLPQSVLINKNGKVHENKCTSPSEVIDGYIWKLLKN